MEGNKFSNMGNSNVSLTTETKKSDEVAVVREAINTFANIIPRDVGTTVKWSVGISSIFILATLIVSNVIMYKELVKHNDMIANIEKKVENANKRHYEMRDMIKKSFGTEEE